MARTLTNLWAEDSPWFASKSCAQIVGIAGDGRLRDGGPTSLEFRALLELVDSETLTRFARECMESGFQDSGLVLQDVMNEVGSRLGFKVSHGRYRGKQNMSGHDGLWRAADGKHLVVELKTTDAYRINLDVLAGYRSQLESESVILKAESSILLVVGRQDTGDLEAQIRGSRHAWDVRVVSVDALLRLMELKQQMTDWGTSSQINSLLRPIEYTRVDGIVELLFVTARDTEDNVIPDENGELVGGLAGGSKSDSSGSKTFDHDQARAEAIAMAEKHLGVRLKKKGRVFWGSPDGRVNVVCLSSRPHDDSVTGQGFWYGLKPGQVEFLAESADGYLLLACGFERRPLLLPWSEFEASASKLKTSPPEPEDPSRPQHWHISLYHSGTVAEMNVPLDGGRRDFSTFLL